MKDILKEEKAQGATEYLIMLAAVLVVVAASVGYVLSTGGMGGETAENQENQIDKQLENDLGP